MIHCCAGPCHDGVLAHGSPTVFVNGKEAGRITDPITCGDFVATGSPNVYAENGGGSGGGSGSISSGTWGDADSPWGDGGEAWG